MNIKPLLSIILVLALWIISGTLYAETITVSSNDPQVQASLNLDGTTRIQYGQQEIRVKVTSSGKTKYINANGDIIAKVNRYDDGGIKLKDENGDVLWKIKRKDNSVKIADNNEMNNAYKIKIKESGKEKIYLNDEKIGEAKSSKGQINIQVNNKNYQLDGSFLAYASVIGIDAIPMALRLVIVAELQQ